MNIFCVHNLLLEPIDGIDDLNEFGNSNAVDDNVADILEADDAESRFFCSLCIFDFVHNVLDADIVFLFSDPCEPSPSEPVVVDCCNP